MTLSFRDNYLWLDGKPIGHILREFEPVGHVIAAQSHLALEVGKFEPTDQSGGKLLKQMANESVTRLVFAAAAGRFADYPISNQQPA